MSEQDDALREMARHRGLRLAKSRRRKPGGDFGRYGLKDDAGREVFGFGAEGFTAGAEEIEAYLRDATRATWGSSAKAVKAPKRKPSPPPPPAPKPAPKLKVDNLFDDLPDAGQAEAFTNLLARGDVRIERIVSHGQATPADAPMVQDWDEWVIVLQGAAGIRVADSAEAKLGPGDHLLIAAGQAHWVTWTARDRPTVWLAVHLTAPA
jgi:uncharacterized cupin superfamily protein